jgi:predicted transcriptional regulator
MSIELLKQEELVFNVVQEYLNKNRYFNIKEILPFINSRFKMAAININVRGIEEILKSLVQKKLIVNGSKLSKSAILDNPKRKLIYNFIVDHPGTYFYRIMTKLNISNHVVVWHLNMLVKFDFIRKEKFENKDIYFDSKLDFKSSKFKYITSKEKSQKIIDYLRNNDYGITKTQLAKILNMHTNTISKYLKTFEQLDIVIKKKVSKRNIYFLNEDYLE